MLALETTCMHRGDLATNPERGNKPALNNRSKQCFAVDTEENKFIIKAMAFHIQTFLEVKRYICIVRADEKEVSPWAHLYYGWACVKISLECGIVAFSVTYNSQCQRVSHLSTLTIHFTTVSNIHFKSDLFSCVKEACLHVHVTDPICHNWVTWTIQCESSLR